MGALRDVLTLVVGTLRTNFSDPLPAGERARLKDDSGQWIWLNRASRDSVFPVVTVNMGTISTEPAGLGEGNFSDRTEVIQTFIGDGIENEFDLTYVPFTVDSVEYPIGTVLRINDYWDINATDNALAFRDAPASGGSVANIKITYRRWEECNSVYLYDITIPFTFTFYLSKNTQLAIGSENYSGSKLIEYLSEAVLEKWTLLRRTLEANRLVNYVSEPTRTTIAFDEASNLYSVSIETTVNAQLQIKESDFGTVGIISEIDVDYVNYATYGQIVIS